MWGEDAGAIERTHLGRHEPLRARTEPRQHAVARLWVDEAIAPQRLHVDEYVLGALAAGEKAEAAGAVEPFDDDDLEAADRADLGAQPRRRDEARVAGFGSLTDMTRST